MSEASEQPGPTTELLQAPLAGDLTAAAQARRLVREVCVGMSSELQETGELVASELAANAVRHGNPPADITLQRWPDRIRITVSSGLRGSRPQVRAPSPDTPHGRGLSLVSRMADDWGWHESGARITVWAQVSARD